jgi:hypothetical protein
LTHLENKKAERQQQQQQKNAENKQKQASGPLKLGQKKNQDIF